MQGPLCANTGSGGDFSGHVRISLDLFICTLVNCLIGTGSCPFHGHNGCSVGEQAHWSLVSAIVRPKCRLSPVRRFPPPERRLIGHSISQKSPCFIVPKHWPPLATLPDKGRNCPGKFTYKQRVASEKAIIPCRYLPFFPPPPIGRAPRGGDR